MNKFFDIGIAISPSPTNFGPLLFSGWMEKGLSVASREGFSVVELSLRTTQDVDLFKLLPYLKKLSLKISAIATGQACLFDALCLSSPNNQKQADAVAHFKAITNLAAELNAGAVIVGGIRGRLSGNLEKQQNQFKRGVDAIQECAEWAEQKDLTLLIEPINRYEMNWINTVSQGLEVLDSIAVPSARLLLDTFHMNIEETDMLQAFRLAGDRLGYVHFADNTRHAPGQGQVDFDAILQVLKDIHFSGPLVSEILPLPDDLTAVRNTAQFWKKRSLMQ